MGSKKYRFVSYLSPFIYRHCEFNVVIIDFIVCYLMKKKKIKTN